MTQIVQGSLVMIGMNTNKPQVYWNGNQILGITTIHTMWEDDDIRITLKVTAMEDDLLLQLQAQGIKVKKVKQ